MSVEFNWFKEYEIIHSKIDRWYDNYRLFYDGGDSASHSYGNVIIVQNLIEKYSGKRIPQISSEGVHLSNNKINLIEPSEMVEICNKILANTECDEFDMHDRIEWFKELSENGYYLIYDCDW